MAGTGAAVTPMIQDETDPVKLDRLASAQAKLSEQEDIPVGGIGYGRN
jgi:hypothetical protein